nr:virulence-associated protein E [Bradyrhizobium sp. 1(2017)]
MCRCPAHEERIGSLSLGYGRDGIVLVHCFGGCDQQSVIEALKLLGLWPGSNLAGARESDIAKAAVSKEASICGSASWAAEVWNNSTCAKGSLVEIYLRRRGLTVAIPPAIRFHHGLRHPEGSRWPAMVALVTGAIGNAPTAIHRTFLSRDGTSKAPVETAKMMLGPCSGGIVRLGGQGGVLLIGEGIETCLSAMQATEHRTWAALSTSGLRRLDLPDDERDVVVLADADAPGEAAAMAAARRWAREGRRVRVARPPAGMDFNDMLIACRPTSDLVGFGSGQGPTLPRSASGGSSYEGDLPCR